MTRYNRMLSIIVCDSFSYRDVASLCISVVYSMVAFGPVLGFLLGAFFLKYNVDSFSFDTSAISTQSGQWVGAQNIIIVSHR